MNYGDHNFIEITQNLRCKSRLSRSSCRACRAVLFDNVDTAKMHGLDTSNVSSRDQPSGIWALSNSAGIHNIGFVMCGSWHSSFHGRTTCRRWWDITTSGSCPPCWKCTNVVAYTIIWSSAANNTLSYYICRSYARFIAINVSSGIIRFSDLKS